MDSHSFSEVIIRLYNPLLLSEILVKIINADCFRGIFGLTSDSVFRIFTSSSNKFLRCGYFSNGEWPGHLRESISKLSYPAPDRTGNFLLGAAKRIFRSKTNCVSNQNLNRRGNRPESYVNSESGVIESWRPQSDHYPLISPSLCLNGLDQLFYGCHRFLTGLFLK
jgi:hypothetical protein